MTGKNVAKKNEPGLPAELMQDMAGDAGKGLGNADASCFAVPFLTVLQSNSPQVDPTHAKYVEGAAQGMLYNSVTNELYDGAKGVRVIPCMFKHSFIEWVPRDQGGGFAGEHDPSENLISKTEKDDNGKDILPNGNELRDTRTHFVLMEEANGTWSPAVLSLSSTQIKKSKAWLSRIQKQMVGEGDKAFNPPSFAYIYLVTTTSEENRKGKFKGYKIDNGTLIADGDLYQKAKAFAEQIDDGRARAAYENEEPAGDDIPEDAKF